MSGLPSSPAADPAAGPWSDAALAEPQAGAAEPAPAAPADSGKPGFATLIVGSGLVGASIGLALRAAGRTVYLDDVAPEMAAAAASLGAGEQWDRRRPSAAAVGLVIVAVPPRAIAEVAAAQLAAFPEATVADVGSVKAAILADLLRRGAPVSRYVGSHPMAGSHRSGPVGARADLFRDRTWVITPHDWEDYVRTAAVEELAVLCGSRVELMSAAEHDVAVAQVSHLPQLMSSLVAGRLNAVPYRNLALAGQGVRDVTRIAASDPDLWGQIIALNREAVRVELEQIQADLADLLAHLDSTPAVRRLVARGRDGVTGLPGKHGRGRGQTWERVVVELPDRPGALGDIFAEVGRCGINVEDFAIEHDPVRLVGELTIMVDGPERAARLAAHMAKAGWALRA
ncbi:MAG: prephenate dehydrogenase [Propionibacteriaceae bacterium]|jgi:prephenate dehydrogenase|nr:prephenate dehydrogenase [Propionibacteriaceae bacterium]